MSSEVDKQAVIHAIDGITPSSSGWIRVRCPFCESEDKKLSVNVGGGKFNGYYQCWRPSCAKRGFIYDRTVDISIRKKTDHTSVSVDLPEGFKYLTEESGGGQSKILAKYRRYLHGRGVSQEIINETLTGCCTSGPFREMVVVPFLKKGEVVGWGARSIHKKQYHYPSDMDKVHNPFNQDALFERTAIPLLIVEGFFDAMPHWPFALAVGGQPTDYHWEELFPKARRPIVMALDADVQQKNEMGAALLLLKGVRAKFLQLPPGTDPGGTSREKVLRKAFSLFPESFQ